MKKLPHIDCCLACPYLQLGTPLSRSESTAILTNHTCGQLRLRTGEIYIIWDIYSIATNCPLTEA